jgi:N-methylhydantoinase B
LFGGGPAQVGYVLVTQPGETKPTRYHKVTALVLKEGATVEFLSAGGGGRGPAYEREVSRVVEDVLHGYVTLEGARRDYGVALDADLNVMLNETQALRAKLAQSALHAKQAVKELQA